MKKDSLDDRMRDYYCCFLVLHVKAFLNVKKSASSTWCCSVWGVWLAWLNQTFLKLWKLQVRSGSCCDSQSHADILRNNFHFAEHWYQTKTLEILYLPVLKERFSYLNWMHKCVGGNKLFCCSDVLLFAPCHPLGVGRELRQPVTSSVCSSCYVQSLCPNKAVTHPCLLPSSLVSQSEHGFWMPFFTDQWRWHVCHLCRNAAEKLLGLVIQ